MLLIAQLSCAGFYRCRSFNGVGDDLANLCGSALPLETKGWIGGQWIDRLSVRWLCRVPRLFTVFHGALSVPLCYLGHSSIGQWRHP